MLRINKIIVTAFCLGFLANVHAQNNAPNPYADTLTVHVENDLSLVFAFKYLTAERPKLTDELWKSILGAMESSIRSSEISEGVVVTYRTPKSGSEQVAKIVVRPLDVAEDIFLIDKKGIKHSLASRIEFVIVQPEVKIVFSLNDIDQLSIVKEVSIESVWEGVQEKPDKIKYRRAVYLGSGKITNGSFKIDEISHSGPNEFLEFSVGVGLGFYRDRFVPDATLDLAFHFNDRFNRPSTKIGVLFTTGYFFSERTDGKFDLDVNSFISGYFTISFPNENEFGLGFGYLIKQEGSFYKGDVFKLTAFNRKSNASKINITPELIFQNGFKNSFPALRFGLSF